MRWIGFGTNQLRTYSSGVPDRDFSRIVSLYKFWEKYTFRHDILAQDQPAVDISRSGKKHGAYARIGVNKGCPRVVLMPRGGWIEEGKAYVTGYVEDFSQLTEFTLGGNETLQFHRSAAQKLTKIQKEALNITQEDFLGDNGFLMSYPYMRHEMGPYIHAIDLTELDALGNTHPMENGEPGVKMFCRYKVVLGGIYKFDSLQKHLQRQAGLLWNQKIKTPKDYTFKWPRYTFVELDICQQAFGNTIVTLGDNRFLHDFHVFSF